MDASHLVKEWKDAQIRYFEVQKRGFFSLRNAGMQVLNVEWRILFGQLYAIAESADSEVWYCIADGFDNGRGTAVDHDKAELWFRRASEAGNTRAMVRLSLILSRSESTSAQTEAIAWCRKAAEAGDSRGMVWLGFAYREGRGVTADPWEAVKWFTKAVEAGDHHSMVFVGRMYSDWLNAPTEAVTWLTRAAQAGFRDSYVPLALLYDDPKSPVHNPIEAVKWYHVIAEQSGGSSARGMLALAIHYRDGSGVERSLENARTWLQRAIKASHARSPIHRKATKLLGEIRKDRHRDQ